MTDTRYPGHEHASDGGWARHTRDREAHTAMSTNPTHAASSHVCDQRTDGAGAVYYVARTACPACGEQAGDDERDCPNCGGDGYVAASWYDPTGCHTERCPECKGTGRRVEQPTPPQGCGGPERCRDDAHDHYEDGEPLRCDDCGRPLHYDERVGDYRHDDPHAPDCFLVRG